MSQSLRARIAALFHGGTNLLDRDVVLSMVAEHEREQAAVAMGVQPVAQPSEKVGELPAWLRELERLQLMACDKDQIDLRHALLEIYEVRSVLLTGKGEAKVPACVVRRILKNWCGLWDGWTLRIVDLRAYALRSPDGLYTYCATAEEFMEHLDAAGNGLLP